MKVVLLKRVALLVLTSAFLFSPAGEEKKVEKKPVDKTKVENKAETTPTAPKTQGQAGQVVSINPETGEFEANPDMGSIGRELGEITDVSTEGLTQEVMSDGTVIVDLQGRFQSAMVVEIGEDGKLKSFCQTTNATHDAAKCKLEHKPVKQEQQK